MTPKLSTYVLISAYLSLADGEAPGRSAPIGGQMPADWLGPEECNDGERSRDYAGLNLASFTPGSCCSNTTCTGISIRMSSFLTSIRFVTRISSGSSSSCTWTTLYGTRL